MYDARGKRVWSWSHRLCGQTRGLWRLPKPANDDGRQAIYPRPRTTGNLALKADSEGVLHEPSAAYDCPIRFQGQWADAEIGLYYNHHRYYDPAAGQYVSRDPVGLAAGLRLHGYVANPGVWVDPLGKTARVGRWMSPDEYQAMRSIGRVQEGAGDQTFVANSGLASSRQQAKPRSIYVEFDVPKNSLLKGGRDDRQKLIGPNAQNSQQRMLEKQGGELLPKFQTLSSIIERKLGSE